MFGIAFTPSAFASLDKLEISWTWVTVDPLSMLLSNLKASNDSYAWSDPD